MRKYVILILILGLIFISGCAVVEKECASDNECAPATCCHASECIPKAEAPDCASIYCSAECAIGTMDCGQGYCRCADNKCTAVYL